jgi:hypothetical protein
LPTNHRGIVIPRNHHGRASPPEFRKKWPQFGKIAEEIDPCLYDLVHVEAA